MPIAFHAPPTHPTTLIRLFCVYVTSEILGLNALRVARSRVCVAYHFAPPTRPTTLNQPNCVYVTSEILRVRSHSPAHTQYEHDKKNFTQPLAQPNICVKATSINVLSRISGVQKILPFKIIFLQTQESGVTHIRLTLNCALNISGSKSLFLEVKGLSYTPMTTTGLPTNISFSK